MWPLYEGSTWWIPSCPRKGVFARLEDRSLGEKAGGMKLAPATVVRFVRTLPDEPIPPPDQRFATVQPKMNLWRF